MPGIEPASRLTRLNGARIGLVNPEKRTTGAVLEAVGERLAAEYDANVVGPRRKSSPYRIGRHLSGRRSEFYLASEGGDTPFPPCNTRKFLASSTAGFPAGSTFMGPPFPPLASLSQILSSYPSGAY